MRMGHFNGKIGNSRDRVVGGHPKPHIWNQRPQIAYSLYNFYGATTTIKGSLHGSTIIVKRFSAESCPFKSVPKMAVFRQLWGVMINFCFLTPKTHILARNRVVWRITRENRFRGVGCRPFVRIRTKKKPSKHLWCTILRIIGKETPGGIMTKFWLWVDIQDVITCVTFVDDRLRGLGVARSRISRFPIDLRRRPYNTLALPCECVMTSHKHAAQVK